MKDRNFKYEIKGTDQFISIPCSYKTIERNFLIKEYIVTQELLDDNDIPLKKFIAYLKGELDLNDKYLNDCRELHIFNGAIDISSKKNHLQKDSLKKDDAFSVIEIVTAQEKFCIKD